MSHKAKKIALLYLMFLKKKVTAESRQEDTCKADHKVIFCQSQTTALQQYN